MQACVTNPKENTKRSQGLSHVLLFIQVNKQQTQIGNAFVLKNLKKTLNV